MSFELVLRSFIIIIKKHLIINKFGYTNLPLDFINSKIFKVVIAPVSLMLLIGFHDKHCVLRLATCN